jgi:hypothetical protein
MTVDRQSQPGSLGAHESVNKTEIVAHTVQAKLGRLGFEIFVALAAIYGCISLAKYAWFEGEIVELTFSIIAFVVAIWWLASQLSAISRLVFFGGACVMDQNSFKHFSMGTVAWSAIRGAELMVIERANQEDKRPETFLVVGLDRHALDLIQPNWMRQFALMRYARFSHNKCAVELSCDFLKIEPHRLLWHVRQRADRLGGQRLADWNGTEPVENIMRRRKRLAESAKV